MINPLLLQIGAGLLGGLTRAVVGVIKAQQTSPTPSVIDWKYFGFSVLSSGFVGMIAGLVLNGDWLLSILAGYAGSDFLDNLYKMKFNQAQTMQRTKK